MNKKPRSDSKLDSLPEQQLLELRDGLLSGWKLEDAKSWLIVECGVSSALSAVSGFYKRHCVPVIRDRRQLAALKAEAITEGVGLTDWDGASIERLRQTVFEFMSDPNADIEATERLFKLLLKSRDQEVDRRKLVLLEEKAKQADAAAGLAKDGKLTDEEKAAELKRIFRMG